MASIELVPSEDDMANLMSKAVGGELSKTECTNVEKLGELVISGELVVVGSNLAVNDPQAIKVAERDDVKKSIIGLGVSVSDTELPYEQEGEKAPPAKKSEIIGSLLIKATVENSEITNSSLTKTITLFSTVKDSDLQASEVHYSTIEDSSIQGHIVRRSKVYDSELEQNSRRHNPSNVTDSTLVAVKANTTTFYNTRFNTDKHPGEKNEVYNSNLNSVDAYNTNMIAVTAKETKFGITGGLGLTRPGGTLRYLKFTPLSRVYKAYGGGDENFIPTVSGVHNNVDFAVSSFAGSYPQFHITKRDQKA